MTTGPQTLPRGQGQALSPPKSQTGQTGLRSRDPGQGLPIRLAARLQSPSPPATMIPVRLENLGTVQTQQTSRAMVPSPAPPSGISQQQWQHLIDRLDRIIAILEGPSG